jgi:hypothetical protein
LGRHRSYRASGSTCARRQRAGQDGPARGDLCDRRRCVVRDRDVIGGVSCRSLVPESRRNLVPESRRNLVPESRAGVSCRNQVPESRERLTLTACSARAPCARGGAAPRRGWQSARAPGRPVHRTAPRARAGSRSGDGRRRAGPCSRPAGSR